MFLGIKAKVLVSDTFLILSRDKRPAQPRIMEAGNVGSISQHACSAKCAPRQQIPLLNPLLNPLSAISHTGSVPLSMADILQRNNITCV